VIAERWPLPVRDGDHGAAPYGKRVAVRVDEIDAGGSGAEQAVPELGGPNIRTENTKRRVRPFRMIMRSVVALPSWGRSMNDRLRSGRRAR
jgi:hypothetical protein